MNGREYDDLSENFHFNGSNIDEEDEALFREKSTLEALMSFTMLPLRRTLRDDRRKVGRECGRQIGKERWARRTRKCEYIGTMCRAINLMS